MKIRMKIERSVVRSCSTIASVGDGGDPGEAIATEVLSELRTDLNVTIGEHTMFLAAWEDPGHWAEDWAKKLGIELDEVEDAVARLFAEADEERV